MSILEQIYNTSLPKINFLQRKVSITSSKTLLYGPPRCGKTYLIFDYLSKLKPKDYLYINFKQYKNIVAMSDIQKFLPRFVLDNGITTLVIDNFDFDFELPNIQNIIITSDVKNTHDGFKKLQLMPLDFAEYLSFDSTKSVITGSFDNFLKFGNMPEITTIHHDKKELLNIDMLKLFTSNKKEWLILSMFTMHSGQLKSAYYLFNHFKKNTKISKNTFYETIKKFQDNNLIMFCEKYQQQKSVKRIFTFNHSLLNTLAYEKKINFVFSNMIFLELFANTSEIYYLDNVDFYIPKENTIFLSMPFLQEDIKTYMEKNITSVIENLNIQKIYIITISTQMQFKFLDMPCEVMPFYEWSLIK